MMTCASDCLAKLCGGFAQASQSLFLNYQEPYVYR